MGINFNLRDEPGCGSLDASAGIGKDDFSFRWTGRRVTPNLGTYAWHGDCDGIPRLWLDGAPVLDKDDHRRRNVQGKFELAAGRAH